MIEQQLDKIREKLVSCRKQRLLCISTTANKNNADLIFGSIRETSETIAGNIILRSKEFLPEIINYFDGLIDYFLIDSEIKNELQNLEVLALSQIKRSKYLIYKPNDFTVASLDMFIAVKTGSLFNKKILILGCGNIGAKIALCLCERGAQVFVYDIDIDKSFQVTSALNLVKKSNSEIIGLSNIEIETSIDILIGCTPGIAAVNSYLISITNDYVIDAGNGCLSSDGILEAGLRNIPIYVLSSIPGYWGMVLNWMKTTEMQKLLKLKKITEKNSIITPGILGAFGDIIVDDVAEVNRIIGLCDGKGDILYQKDAEVEFDRILDEIDDTELKIKLKKAYLYK